MTKQDLERIKFIKEKVSIDRKWAIRALNRIFEAQTAEEQNSDSTINNNGIGFSAVDATILTGIKKFVDERGYISDKQLGVLFKKLPKYASQLLSISNVQKIDMLIASRNQEGK